MKPHDLGNRVGEAFIKRCLVVGLFVADLFQIRDHGRRPHQAADMAYDDATIRPQHISASSLRQVQYQHPHSVK